MPIDSTLLISKLSTKAVKQPINSIVLCSLINSFVSNLKRLDGLSNNSIDYCCLLKTKNLKTLESIFKIFEKLFIYFGILEKFN